MKSEGPHRLLQNPKGREESLFQSDDCARGGWVSEPVDPDPWIDIEKRAQRPGASAKSVSALTAVGPMRSGRNQRNKPQIIDSQSPF